MSKIKVYNSTGKGKVVLTTKEGVTSVTDLDNRGFWVHPPIYPKNIELPPRKFRPPNEDGEEHFFILNAQSGSINVGLESKLYIFSEEDDSYFVVPESPRYLIYDSHKTAVENQELDTESLNFLYSNNFRHRVSDAFPQKFMHYDGETGAFGTQVPTHYVIENTKQKIDKSSLFPYQHILKEDGSYKYYNISTVVNRDKDYFGFGISIKRDNTYVALHDHIPFLRQFIVCNYFTITGIFENLGGGNLVWTGDYIALGETPQGISKGMSYFYPNMHSHSANNYGINVDGEEYLNTLRNNHTINYGGTMYADGVSYTPEGIMRPNMLRHFSANPFSTDLTDRKGTWSIRWNFSIQVGMYPYYEPGDPLPVYDTSTRERNFPDFVPSLNYTEVSNWIPSAPYYYEVDRNPPPIFFIDTQSVVFDNPDEEKIVKIVSYRLGDQNVEIEHLYTTAISNHTPNPIYSPPSDEFFELTPNNSISLPTGEMKEIKVKLKKNKIDEVISNYYTSYYMLTPTNDLEGVNSLSLAIHWSPPQSRNSIDIVEMRLGDKIQQRIVNNFCNCIIDNTEYDFYFQPSSFREDVELSLECVNQPDNVSIDPPTINFSSIEPQSVSISWTGDPNELQMNTFTDIVIKGICSSSDDPLFDGKEIYYNIRVYPTTPTILWDVRSNSTFFGFLHFESSDTVELEISKFIRPLDDQTTVTIKFDFPNTDLVSNSPTFSFNVDNWYKSQSTSFTRNPTSYKKDLFQCVDILMESNNPSFNGLIGKLFISTRYPISYSNYSPISLTVG